MPRLRRQNIGRRSRNYVTHGRSQCSSTFNVAYCNSVKSIKYICKYVNKGNDMAVFGVAAENSHDEIAHHKMGRYINTNEAHGRIFSSPVYERFKNGQRVYFTNENVQERAATIKY